MPAFRWYEKETGPHDGLEPREGRHRARAAALRRWRPARRGWSQPRQHVLGRCASLFGDDERDSGTVNAREPRSISPTSPIPMASAHDRSLPLGRRGRAPCSGRQRRRGEEHINRGGLYPWDEGRDHRGHARPQRGDAARRHCRGRSGGLLDLRRLRRGRPPLWDRAARSFAVLRQHDAELARLEPRPSLRRRVHTTWWCSRITVRARAGRFGSATARRSTSWSEGP